MRLRRLALGVLVGVTGLMAAPAGIAAATAAPDPSAITAPTTPDAHAGEPWWVPAGLQGQSVTAVAVSGSDVEIVAGGRDLVSADGGATFRRPVADPGSTAGPVAAAEVRSGDDQWLIRGGRILHARSGGAPALDPGSPDLGATADLLAAPLASRGVVVAVSDQGVVWRRTATGDWGRSLVLLPRSLVGGVPRITAISAFTSTTPGGGAPATVYLATDGYSVLATQNGGEDWFRDGPGLPDRVHGLAAAPQQSAILAATDDGLWVHHLRVLPGVPRYPAPDLSIRQKGIAAVTLAACALSAAGLVVGLRRRPHRAR